MLFPYDALFCPAFEEFDLSKVTSKDATSNGSLKLTSYNGATTYGSRPRSRQLLDNLRFLGALSPMCIIQITLLPLE